MSAAITELPIPKTVVIPLAQHLGVPSKPIVQKGDQVKVGQLIAQSNGFISANIHASVSGKVVKIEPSADSTGYKRDAIFIETEGDEWMDGIDRSATLVKEIKLDRNAIIDKIAQSGIVGLGGATFPSHVKTMVPKGKKAEYLLINGVECEPYLTADHRLMLEKTNELVVGIQILMKALDVKKAIIGIENNKPDAIAIMKEAVKNIEGIKVQALKVQYPQGGEKQLISAVLGREVPSGGLPIDIGAVVYNVGSVFAIYEAVQKNKPLVERVVTITGKQVKKPSNFKVRIGTSVLELIEQAGGLPENTGKILNGGPMMGKALAQLDVPVVKGSSGILLIPEQEAIRKEVFTCIRCTKCISVCPMGLEPYLLGIEGEKGLYDKMENDRVMDCIECGSCSYVCPAGRPLLDYIRLGKGKVGQIIRKRNTK